MQTKSKPVLKPTQQNIPNMFSKISINCEKYFVDLFKYSLEDMTSVYKYGINEENIVLNLNGINEKEHNIIIECLNMTNDAWFNIKENNIFKFINEKSETINFEKYLNENRYKRCIEDIDYIIYTTKFELPSTVCMEVLIKADIANLIFNKILDDKESNNFLKILLKEDNNLNKLAKCFIIILSKMYRRISPTNIPMRWHLLCVYKFISTIAITNKSSIIGDLRIMLKDFYDYFILPLIKATKIYENLGFGLEEIGYNNHKLIK